MVRSGYFHTPDDMITPEEALTTVLENSTDFGTVEVALDKATHMVLRKPVRADRAMPPFDRVTMDGIAIRYSETINEFVVRGTQTAGAKQMTLSQPGECIEVMTGAMLPENADTIIPYEEIVFSGEGAERKAMITGDDVKAGQHIHRKGEDRRQEDVLLSPGTLLTPTEISVAAAVGQPRLSVSRTPRVAIVSTGDELVDVYETPEDHQIRRSNVYALKATLQRMNIHSDLFHYSDSKSKIRRGLEEAFQVTDVLVLSGGVSKGKKDFIPAVLEDLGVQKLFHRVRQKPGKPFWFGLHPDGKAVFALPGNPVSTFMCFHKYMKPWLMKSMQQPLPEPAFAVLDKEVHFMRDLNYMMQVKLHTDNHGVVHATPEEGNGSGDFANLLQCDAFMELLAGRNVYPAGEAHPVILYR